MSNLPVKDLFSRDRRTDTLPLFPPRRKPTSVFPFVLGLTIVIWLSAGVITLFSLPNRNTQNIILIVSMWCMAFTSLAGTWLCRTSREQKGVYLVVVGLLIGFVALSYTIAGYGLILGISAFIITSALVINTLPTRDANNMFAISALIGVAVYLIDIINPPNRIPLANNLQFFFPFIIILLIAIYLLILVLHFRDFSLSIKILIPFAILSLLSIIAATAYNLNKTRTVLLDSTNEALRAAALQTSVGVSAFLDNIQASLSEESQLADFQNYFRFNEKERRNTVEEDKAIDLLNNLKASGNAVEYYLLDLQGNVWLSSATLIDHSKRELPYHFFLDQVEPDYLQKLLRMGLPYMTPVVFLVESIPSLFFLDRIDDVNRQPIGVLVSQYQASDLQKIVEQSNDLAGLGSFAVLLDENNLRLGQGANSSVLYRFVTLPSPDLLAKLRASQRLPDRPVDQLTTDYPELSKGIAEMRQEPFFTTRESGSTLNSAAVVSIPGRNWRVVFMQSQDLLLKPIEGGLNASIFIAVLVAILVSIAAVGISQLIIRPISRLTSVAESITKGSEGLKVPVNSQDEIGSLSNTFNVMTQRLYETLDNLETRVQERTSELAEASEQSLQRVARLQTIADVARSIASIQNIDQLLPLITQTISERFGFYHVGIFLMDPNREYAVLRAANSDGGQQMLAREHRLKVGQVGIVGYVTDRGEPRIALDVGQDAVFFNNPYLPETRSEMALPLKLGPQVIGALDVQSKDPGAFKEDDLVALSSLADQVAIAIENARLFSETRHALTEAQTAQKEYLRVEWDRITAQTGQSGYEYSFGQLTPISEVQPVKMEDGLEGQEKIKETPSVQPTEPTAPGSEELVVPISLRGQLIGLIKLQDQDNQRVLTEAEVSLVKSVADQVGLALENARLLEATKRRAERESMVGRITSQLRASNDPQAIMQTAVAELTKALRIQKGKVVIQPAKKPNTLKVNGEE